MQGLTAKGVRDRDARRERVRVIYGDGGTIARIARELGVSEPTILKDVNALAETGLLRKRARGEAISTSVSEYWQSDAGRVERQRRSQKLRSAPPVERVCEWCDEHFELSAKRARQEPGRFCSQECANAWRLAAVGLEPLRGGRRRWRDEVAKFNAENPHLLNCEGVIKSLPRKFRRTPAAVLGHIAHGGLEPCPNDLGLLRFTKPAVDHYIAWLRDHPDARLRMFARERFRRRWILGRKAGVLFRSGYSTAEAARELGYTTNYVAKLWRRREVTPEVEFARLHRRLLSLLSPGLWLDLREVYRTLHLSAQGAGAAVDELVRRGEIERRQDGRRVILRRVSQNQD